MTVKKSAPKKARKKAAPKYASVASVEALAADVAHLNAVIVNRLGFDPSAEPVDIIESGDKGEIVGGADGPLEEDVVE